MHVSTLIMNLETANLTHVDFMMDNPKCVVNSIPVFLLLIPCVVRVAVEIDMVPVILIYIDIGLFYFQITPNMVKNTLKMNNFLPTEWGVCVFLSYC